ncbi:MAG: pitrilysin family protein [Pseudomonadota bacterium]
MKTGKKTRMKTSRILAGTAAARPRRRVSGFATLTALAVGCASPALPLAAAPASPPAETALRTAPVVAAGPAAAPAPAPTPPPPPRTTPDAPFRAQPPSPAPEPVFSVPKFKRFKLKNGTEVILSEVHDLPLLELHMIVKTGGSANEPGAAGLADLTANMLDEGTKSRSALEIAEQIGDLGATLATIASWDASVVTLSTLARNLDATMAIWADVITRPAFSEKELARVRDNLVTAVARRKDSPPTVASIVLARLLFGDRHPFGWPQAGVEESLKKLTAADVRRFYATYYHPGNATIIAAGDISQADLRKKLEAALAGWRPTRVPAVKVPAAPSLDKMRIVLVDKPGAPQSSIRVGFVGVRRADPDYFPILLMNQIFGGSFYRLDMNLRERQQWTYGARSGFDMRRTPGPASAGGEFVAAHTADAVAEILKEMQVMATTEVSDEELTRAKDNFIKAFPARFATRGSTAGVLGELAVYGLPDNFLANYTKNVQAVSKEEIRRVAQKFLVPDKMLIVVVGDRATQETALAKLGPVELRDLDGNPVAARPPAKDGPMPPPAKGGGAGNED